MPGWFVWIIPETSCEEREVRGKNVLARVMSKDKSCIKVICLPDPCSNLELEIIDEYRRAKYPDFSLIQKSIYHSALFPREITLPYYTKTEEGGFFRKVGSANRDDVARYISEGKKRYLELRQEQIIQESDKRKVQKEIKISKLKRKIADPQLKYWERSFKDEYMAAGLKTFSLRLGSLVQICDLSVEQEGYYKSGNRDCKLVCVSGQNKI